MTNPLESVFREWAKNVQPTSLDEDQHVEYWWQSFSEMVRKRYPFPASGMVCDEIFDERCRQQTDEGWTPEHDDRHFDGELAQAAAAYALWASKSDIYRQHYELDPPVNWPFPVDEQSTFKPSNRRDELIKAGGLIVAEIERLDRAAAYDPTTQQFDEPLRHAPFGPVGSGHVPRGSTATVNAEREIPGVKSANRNLEEVPESVYAPIPGKITPGHHDGISITEERFKKWAASHFDHMMDDLDQYWQSFKEAAGWPRY